MKKRSSCKINGFNYPAADKISSRTSTLCRSMACTLLTREACSPKKEEEWMDFFPDKTCAYCGRPATHLDHLYALIIGRQPTGYGTEPGNLVPCCRKCNQPKSNLHWEVFMRSDKCMHVGTKNNPDPQKAMLERIGIIKDFQKRLPAQCVAIDATMMAEWDKLLGTLDHALKDAELILENMKTQLYAGTTSNNQVQAAVGSTKSSKRTAKNSVAPAPGAATTNVGNGKTSKGKMKKYCFNGKEYSMRGAAVAIVEKYVADNPSVTYSDLCRIFNLVFSFNSKPWIRLLSDLSQKEKDDKRASVDNPLRLSDGNVVVVNKEVLAKQWQQIVGIATALGYVITEK